MWCRGCVECAEEAEGVIIWAAQEEGGGGLCTKELRRWRYKGEDQLEG